jgi:hypothetical protein
MRRTCRTAANLPTRPAHDPTPPRDLGTSIIEVIISIVLLGTIVSATLAGLATTINASALDRDHANAHAWLQTGADMLYARDLINCGTMDPDPATDMAMIAAEYEATVQQTDNPEGWSDANIQVVGLEWWSIEVANGIGTEAWGLQCDEPDTSLQKVKLRVTAEDGRIVEEVEVIIDG